MSHAMILKKIVSVVVEVIMANRKPINQFDAPKSCPHGPYIPPCETSNMFTTSRPLYGMCMRITPFQRRLRARLYGRLQFPHTTWVYAETYTFSLPGTYDHSRGILCVINQTCSSERLGTAIETSCIPVLAL